MPRSGPRWRTQQRHFIGNFAGMQITSCRLRSLTLALNAVFAVGAAHAATITVTTTEDGSIPGECTLRDATLASNDNTAHGGCVAGEAGHDDIVFAPGVAGTISLVSGQLTLAEDTTITGPGAGQLTIDGQGASRIFDITGDASLQTVLSGMTLTGGRTTADGDNGGAIRCMTAFEMVDSVITGNSTAGQNSVGGGLFTATTTVLTRTSVTGNWTEAYGGLAGGVMVAFGSATLTDSTVADNWTEGDTAGGGGIIVFWGWFDALFINSTVSGNATFGYNSQAGGIAAGGAVTLVNSTVSGNATFGAGAAAYAAAGGISTSGSVTLINSTVVDNIPQGGGVAINLAAPDTMTLTVSNSLIANTVTTDGSDITLCSKAIDGDGSTHNLATDASCGTDTLIASASTTPTDLALAPLAANGGPTKTHALLPGSVAIDAADDDVCAGSQVANLDQRGQPRPIDGNGDGVIACDIGAYEAGSDTVFRDGFEAP